MRAFRILMGSRSEAVVLLGRQVRVKTSSEIVAKKHWYRGDRATARDLFDLALVIEQESKALSSGRQYPVRHHDAFLSQIEQRKAVLKLQFDAIDRLDYRVTCERAQRLASEFLMAL